MTIAPPADYFRRDQRAGVTAPDLSKACTFAEHIVRARGKRTPYTSLSLDRSRIDDFGPVLYQALCTDLLGDGHSIIEHDALMQNLRDASVDGDKFDRRRAVQALLYAKRRREGLIGWGFETGNVPRKDLIAWAFAQIQRFFRVIG